MRRSIFHLLTAVAVTVSAASPALASKPNIPSLPAPISPCSLTLPTPDAIDCEGYFAGNLLNGSPTDVANQQQALANLGFNWNGNWSALENSVSPDLVITSLTNGNQLNFGTTMFGTTIIGAHFGNGSSAGNASVFWLFNFGTTGANFVVLDDPQGWSNAALYTTGRPPAVPEPATWAMMLFGFGAAGAALRRSRGRSPKIMQLA